MRLRLICRERVRIVTPSLKPLGINVFRDFLCAFDPKMTQKYHKNHNIFYCNKIYLW